MGGGGEVEGEEFAGAEGFAEVCGADSFALGVDDVGEVFALLRIVFVVREHGTEGFEGDGGGDGEFGLVGGGGDGVDGA